MCGIEPVPVIDAAFVEDAEELEEEEEEEEEVELSQDADSSIDVLVPSSLARPKHLNIPILTPARLHTEAKPDIAVSASLPQCLQM